MHALRHFRQEQLDIIPWESPQVVLIELKGGQVQGYAVSIMDKRELLQRKTTVLVAWPGENRQDIFEMDLAAKKSARQSLLFKVAFG